MRAIIKLVYPAHPSDEQQAQWRAATESICNGGRAFWYIYIFEDYDKEENVHQIAVINDSQTENIHVRVLRFLRGFKGHAPFVKCSNPYFADKLTHKEIRELLNKDITNNSTNTKL